MTQPWLITKIVVKVFTILVNCQFTFKEAYDDDGRKAIRMYLSILTQHFN